MVLVYILCLILPLLFLGVVAIGIIIWTVVDMSRAARGAANRRICTTRVAGRLGSRPPTARLDSGAGTATPGPNTPHLRCPGGRSPDKG